MNALGILAQEIQGLHIPYEFMRWTGGMEYPYFTGEYSEVATLTEDGHKEYTVMVNGFTRGSWLELEQAREAIERHFPTAGGFRAQSDDGSVAIYYSNSFPVPTDEAELKRIQITLDVHEWKGM